MLPKDQQIIATHAALIRAVVEVCRNPTLAHQLDEPLRQLADNGWTALVAAVRAILGGRRDAQLLSRLDAEDRVIIQAILAGLQNPATLPAPQAAPVDPTAAAPGLAGLIADAAHGDTAALAAVANIGEQMAAVGGEMARVAALLRPLIGGERDPDKLTRHLGARGRGLVLSILAELGRHDRH